MSLTSPVQEETYLAPSSNNFISDSQMNTPMQKPRGILGKRGGIKGKVADQKKLLVKNNDDDSLITGALKSIKK